MTQLATLWWLVTLVSPFAGASLQQWQLDNAHCIPPGTAHWTLDSQHCALQVVCSLADTHEIIIIHCYFRKLLRELYVLQCNLATIATNSQAIYQFAFNMQLVLCPLYRGYQLCNITHCVFHFCNTRTTELNTS